MSRPRFEAQMNAPRYRPPGPTLEQLLSELSHVADGIGEVTPADFASARRWLTLPRYARLRDADAASRLLVDDLRSLIASLDAPARDHARILLRFDASDLSLTKRRDLISADVFGKIGGKSESGRTQKQRDDLLLVGLAFRLYQQAVHLVEPDYELDFGFHSIGHVWTLIIDPIDRRHETYIYATRARAIRSGQRFYVFGDELEGATMRAAARLPTEREAEEHHAVCDPRHHVVGSVRADSANPDVMLHVVYVGRAYDVGEDLDVAIVRDSELPQLPSESGLFFQSRGPDIRRATLRVVAPLSIVPTYRCIERDEPGVLPQPEERRIIRADEAAMEFAIDPVIEGREYEIAFTYAAAVGRS